MSISDACKLVILAAEEGSNGQIYILDMGEKVNILDLKESYYPGWPYEVIGIREGETMTEELMTAEEKSTAIKSNNFYIV